MPETSAGEAKQGALAKCNRAGAKGCKSVTAFSDSCVALARNSRNDLFWGNSVSAEIAAKSHPHLHQRQRRRQMQTGRHAAVRRPRL